MSENVSSIKQLSVCNHWTFKCRIQPPEHLVPTVVREKNCWWGHKCLKFDTYFDDKRHTAQPWRKMLQHNISFSCHQQRNMCVLDTQYNQSNFSTSPHWKKDLILHLDSEKTYPVSFENCLSFQWRETCLKLQTKRDLRMMIVEACEFWLVRRIGRVFLAFMIRCCCFSVASL